MGNVNESGKRISFWLLFQISLDVYFTCLCKIEYSCIVGKYTFASSVARLIDKFAPLVVTMLIHCHISLLLDMKAIFLRRILEISCVNLFFGGGAGGAQIPVSRFLLAIQVKTSDQILRWLLFCMQLFFNVTSNVDPCHLRIEFVVGPIALYDAKWIL